MVELVGDWAWGREKTNCSKNNNASGGRKVDLPLDESSFLCVNCGEPRGLGGSQFIVQLYQNLPQLSCKLSMTRN